MRLFSLLGREHTLLLYAGAMRPADDAVSFERVAEAAVAAAHGHVDVYLIAAPDADVETTVLPLIRDSARDFARMYSAVGPSVYVVRPDGYLSIHLRRQSAPTSWLTHLSSTFRAGVSTTATAGLR